MNSLDYARHRRRLAGPGLIIGLALTVTVSVAHAQAPGFDCTKASQPIEHLICATPGLSALDAEMSTVFKRALDASGGQRSEILADQRRWLHSRATVCHLEDKSVLIDPEVASIRKCVEELYHDRIEKISIHPVPAPADNVCNALASQLRIASSPPASEDPWAQPILALSRSPGAILHVEPVRMGQTSEVVKEELRSRYHASTDILDAVDRVTIGGQWMAKVLHFGSTPMHAVEVVMGTAACQHFIFFEMAGEHARAIPVPLAVRKGDESTFCRGTNAWTGEAGGHPAFIVETGLNQDVTIDITPWRNQRWQPACQLAIHFDAAFKVDDSFCQGLNCHMFAEEAQALATLMDHDRKGFSPIADLTPDQRQKYERMKELADAGSWAVQLPTFGGLAKSSYTGFGPDSVLIPITLDGEVYIARIGNGSLGWRESPDYLFAAYALADDKLVPVAGIYVKKMRGKPTVVTIR